MYTSVLRQRLRLSQDEALDKCQYNKQAPMCYQCVVSAQHEDIKPHIMITCVCMHAKRSHMHVKDPVVHGSLVDYGNDKITQHALSVKSLQNVGHYTKEE